jgi:uncharacterized protein YraI
MKRNLVTAALSFSFFATASAFAAEGYITGSANLYSGPDTSYPSVSMLNDGTAVVMEGCVDGWSWCDVASGDNRGWVDGNFLQEEYQGQRVLVPQYAVQIGIPVVSFSFGTYWDDHYRNRSWYGERERFSHVTPHFRPAQVQVNVNVNSHGDSHSSHAPEHKGEPAKQQPAVATAQTEHPGKPVAAVPQHPVATQVQTPKPLEHNAVEPKAVVARPVTEQKPVQPKVIAEHKPVVAPKAPPKETPAKSESEHDSNKDKDQH